MEIGGLIHTCWLASHRVGAPVIAIDLKRKDTSCFGVVATRVLPYEGAHVGVYAVVKRFGDAIEVEERGRV